MNTTLLAFSLMFVAHTNCMDTHKNSDPEKPDFNMTIENIVHIMKRLDELNAKEDLTLQEELEKERLLEILRRAKEHALTFSQQYKSPIIIKRTKDKN